MRDLEKYKLDCEDSYRAAAEDQRNEHYNGCGASWMPKFSRDILDKITKLFKEAIRIHDWDYTILAKTLRNKIIADKRLFRNCFKIIAYHFKWWTSPREWFRHRALARTLYVAVRTGGHSAFFGGKK